MDPSYVHDFVAHKYFRHVKIVFLCLLSLSPFPTRNLLTRYPLVCPFALFARFALCLLSSPETLILAVQNHARKCGTGGLVGQWCHGRDIRVFGDGHLRGRFVPVPFVPGYYPAVLADSVRRPSWVLPCVPDMLELGADTTSPEPRSSR